MKNNDIEYKEIFLAEALGQFEEVNRLLTQLEKNLLDKATVNALFRITHTLKGNAAGMGFKNIADMAHVLEDLFGEIREGRIPQDKDLFTSIYKGVDVLGNLINAVKDNSEVKFKGIKTKLEILLKRAQESIKSEDALTSSLNEPSPILRPFVQEFVDETEALPKAEAPGEADTKITFSDLVQVPVRKLDTLLNLVGELIIEKDRILASQGLNGILGTNEYARLSRISADLQYSVMDVRMVQVGFLFNKFHRVVRDAATLQHKQVALKLEGTDTEIDRNVLQVISDSLIHIIRNAVAHGIETPEERTDFGKPAEGTITLFAQAETDSVTILIKDDGRGLDYNKIRQKAINKSLLSKADAERLSNDDLSLLIFEPGFSTVETIDEISGRGVGMDVVRQTLDSIGGGIKVMSEVGKGATIILTMPSSMAVKSCLLFELDKEVYAIPLSFTESVISIYKEDIKKAGGGLIATHLDKNIAVVFLNDVFSGNRSLVKRTNSIQSSLDNVHPETKLEIVVVHYNNKRVGFVVDKLLQQKEIVEKPLHKPVENIKLVSGVTILGNGKVCLVLNIPFILHHLFNATSIGSSQKIASSINNLN